MVWNTNAWARLNNPSDTNCARLCSAALLLFDAAGCGLILLKVSYTEIDWVAYMQQVQSYLQGERDYSLIKGQTGPLVYPAGFIYIYSMLFHVTAGGSIAAAQLIFAFIYLVNQWVIMQLYISSQALPPWGLILLFLSKRIHSIYLLRMFNDGVTMLLANIATLLLIKQRWRLSLLSFSAALSVKMSVLLMAPPVAVVLLQAAPWKDLILGSLAALFLQVLLALPFLLQYPAQYFSKAFEFSRVFLLQWSVNWSFLPDSLFRSKAFAACLLVGHMSLLLLFAQYKWCKPEGGLYQLLVQRTQSRASSSATIRKCANLSVRNTQRILLTVFTGNLIGITFARTLHFQFYSWYFHTLPFLLWQIKVHTPLSLLILFCTEVSWNTFPPSTASSIVLLVCHCTMLGGLWHSHSWLMRSKSE